MIWIKGTHQSTNIQTFGYSREISPNLYFHRLLFLKVCKISAKKKYREVMSHDIKSDTKFEETLTGGLENDKRNMANFHQSASKSQN